jgi:hypothetical protein
MLELRTAATRWTHQVTRWRIGAGGKPKSERFSFFWLTLQISHAGAMLHPQTGPHPRWAVATGWTLLSSCHVKSDQCRKCE